MIIAISIILILLFMTTLGPAVFAAVALFIVSRAQTDGRGVIVGGRSKSNMHNKHHNKYNKSTHHGPVLSLADAHPPFTYILDTNLLTADDVARYLPADQWTNVPVAEATEVDLAFIISMPDHRPTKSMDISARIRYRLSADELTDKVRFHQHMAGLHPRNIARSFEMHPFSRIPTDGGRDPVWIVRANWGWKGSANVIVHNTDELRDAYKKLARDERSRVLMSEYIVDPRLRDGRKFHARVVVIAGVISDGKTIRRTAVMLPLVELIIAAKPYTKENFTDTDVHDTHYGPEAGHGFLEPTEQLYKDTVECLRGVFTDLLPLVDKYPESPAAYDAFGVDVIYLKDGTPIIMEINKLPGLGFDGEVHDRAINEVINGVVVAAVDPAFGTNYGHPDEVIKLADVSGPIVPETPQKTYLYVGDQLEDADVAKYLPGWRRITQVVPGSSVDLIIGAGAAMASGKLYSVRATMKHRLQIKDLTDKVKLHEHLMDMAPETIPETFRVDDSSTIPVGSAWIIRAGWGYDGQAVKIATTTAEMQEIRREFIEKNPKRNKPGDSGGIIATRYIRNPLLLNGRKFNVRVMMIAVVHSPEAVARGLPRKAIYMLRKCNITTSVLPYVDAEFANPDIHITHSAKPTDPVRYHFDEGYPGDATAAMDKMQEVLTAATAPLLDRVECFPESPAGYEILGADIVFDDTERPYLIEINDVPGIVWLKMIGKGVAEYTKAYLDFLFGAIGGEFGMDVPAEYSVELCRI